MKRVTLPIVIEADADGYFVSCPALQGCYSQGATYEEAVDNIKDAIRLHVEPGWRRAKRSPSKSP
jgi:predicted RNase H-like HicB family nuclease